MQVLYTTPEKMRSLHEWAKDWRTLAPKTRKALMYDLLWYEFKDLQQNDTLDLMRYLKETRTTEYLAEQRKMAQAFLKSC
jgi:hypothetical protein